MVHNAHVNHCDKGGGSNLITRRQLIGHNIGKLPSSVSLAESCFVTVGQEALETWNRPCTVERLERFQRNMVDVKGLHVRSFAVG